jgi:hypothetical protein
VTVDVVSGPQFVWRDCDGLVEAAGLGGAEHG